MTVTQKERVDGLFKMGLHFDGQSYVGHGENEDFNYHHIEFIYDDDKTWEKKINGLKLEIRRRNLDKIIK